MPVSPDSTSSTLSDSAPASSTGDAVSGQAEFVVVANRLPVDLERLPDGTTRWKRSPGGLVTALEPILRSNQGAWVGWAGVADADLDPIIEDGLELYPVPLSAEEINEYYEGFSNATLWPLYHDVIVKPEYHREWWNAYVEVNRRFAEATSKAAAENATVWIQENGDHQLVQAQLVQSAGNSIQMTVSNWNAPVQVTKPPVSG